MEQERHERQYSLCTGVYDERLLRLLWICGYGCKLTHTHTERKSPYYTLYDKHQHTPTGVDLAKARILSELAHFKQLTGCFFNRLGGTLNFIVVLIKVALHIFCF